MKSKKQLHAGGSLSHVRIVIENFLEEIRNCLVEGNHLEISGIETFKVKSQARKARNPKTNQEVNVPAMKKAVFKVSRELNGMLNWFYRSWSTNYDNSGRKTDGQAQLDS